MTKETKRKRKLVTISSESVPLSKRPFEPRKSSETENESEKTEVDGETKKQLIFSNISGTKQTEITFFLNVPSSKKKAKHN